MLLVVMATRSVLALRFPRNFTWLVLLLSVNLARLTSSHSATTPEIEATIEKLVRDQFFPQSKSLGLGLAVVNREGNLVYSNGFGLRDAVANSSMTDRTLFPVATLTASFVSAMIVRTLSERFPQFGESVLEMPISQLAPNYELTLADRFRTEDTSFRDLLSHRSCSTSETLGVLFGAVNGSQDHIYRARYEESICPFRTDVVGSSHLYAIAGDVISHIAARPFELMCRDFLNQLRMTDSKFFSWQDDLTTFTNLAQGHYIDSGDGDKIKIINPNFWRVHTTLNAIAGLLTSPRDMTRFLSFMLNDGMVDGKQVVSKDAMQWLTRPAIALDHTYSYGLGLILQHREEAVQGPIVVHNGHCAPVYSLFVIEPTSGLAVFTSSNGPTEDNDAHYELHMQILSYLLSHADGGSNKEILKMANSSPELPKLNNFGLLTPRKSVEGKLIGKSKVHQKIPASHGSCEADDILGHFGNAVTGQIEIYRESGDQTEGLRIKYGSLGEGVLTKMTDCRYQITWTTDNEFNVYYKVVVNGGDGFKPIMDVLELNHNQLSWTIDDKGSIFFERGLTLEKLPKVPFATEILECDEPRNGGANFKMAGSWFQFMVPFMMMASYFIVGF